MQKPSGKNYGEQKGAGRRLEDSVDAAERMVRRAKGEIRLENVGHAKLYLYNLKIVRNH